MSEANEYKPRVGDNIWVPHSWNLGAEMRVITSVGIVEIKAADLDPGSNKRLNANGQGWDWFVTQAECLEYMISERKEKVHKLKTEIRKLESQLREKP